MTLAKAFLQRNAGMTSRKRVDAIHVSAVIQPGILP
jgi:hypothetical protein